MKPESVRLRRVNDKGGRDWSRKLYHGPPGLVNLYACQNNAWQSTKVITASRLWTFLWLHKYWSISYPRGWSKSAHLSGFSGGWTWSSTQTSWRQPSRCILSKTGRMSKPNSEAYFIYLHFHHSVSSCHPVILSSWNCWRCLSCSHTSSASVSSTSPSCNNNKSNKLHSTAAQPHWKCAPWPSISHWPSHKFGKRLKRWQENWTMPCSSALP